MKRELIQLLSRSGLSSGALLHFCLYYFGQALFALNLSPFSFCIFSA